MCGAADAPPVVRGTDGPTVLRAEERERKWKMRKLTDAFRMAAFVSYQPDHLLCIGLVAQIVDLATSEISGPPGLHLHRPRRRKDPQLDIQQAVPLLIARLLQVRRNLVPDTHTAAKTVKVSPRSKTRRRTSGPAPKRAKMR